MSIRHTRVSGGSRDPGGSRDVCLCRDAVSSSVRRWSCCDSRRPDETPPNRVPLHPVNCLLFYPVSGHLWASVYVLYKPPPPPLSPLYGLWLPVSTPRLPSAVGAALRRAVRRPSLLPLCPGGTDGRTGKVTAMTGRTAAAGRRSELHGQQFVTLCRLQKRPPGRESRRPFSEACGRGGYHGLQQASVLVI